MKYSRNITAGPVFHPLSPSAISDHEIQVETLFFPIKYMRAHM